MLQQKGMTVEQRNRLQIINQRATAAGNAINQREDDLYNKRQAVKDHKDSEQKGLGQSYAIQNREFDTIRKPLETSLEAFSTLRSSLDQGTAAADSVVAPALLKALVAGGGVRITQAEISQFVHGRSTLGDMQATLQKMTSGKSITPTQRQQVYDLLGVVEAKKQAKQQILQDAQNNLDLAESVTDQRAAVRNARTLLGQVDAGTYNPQQQTPKGQQPQAQKQLPPAPAGMVSVQIPGSPVGHVSAAALPKFRQDHPNAVIGNIPQPQQ
jgi:hypothetical protein